MAVVRATSAKIFIGTAAERAAFSTATTGDRFFETDTGFEWVWSGAAWVKRIVPAA